MRMYSRKVVNRRKYDSRKRTPRTLSYDSLRRMKRDSTNVNELIEFLKDAYVSQLNSEWGGVDYFELGNGLYVVVGKDGKDVLAKIAENTDDLQNDYDYDWYMPTDEYGNVWDTETIIDKHNIVETAQWFIREYKSMIK